MSGHDHLGGAAAVPRGGGYGWLPRALANAGASVPDGLAQRCVAGRNDFGDWFLLSERGGLANRASLDRQFPVREVLPFARRGSADDVACLVLRDPDRPRGSVVVVHDGAMSGVEVEEEMASVAEWYARAEAEASERAP